MCSCLTRQPPIDVVCLVHFPQVTGYIQFAQFKSILRSVMPALVADDQLARNVFGVMAGNNDERVAFADFVMSEWPCCAGMPHTVTAVTPRVRVCFSALARCMRGDLEEKLDVMFAVFDVNRDDHIDLVELIGLINRGNAEVG